MFLALVKPNPIPFGLALLEWLKKPVNIFFTYSRSIVFNSDDHLPFSPTAFIFKIPFPVPSLL